MKDTKVLLVATTMGFFTNFELSNINILTELGCKVEAVGNAEINYGHKPLERLNEMGIKTHQINFQRSPFSPKNIAAYKTLKKLIQEFKPDLIHCHTPIAGFLTRLACRKNQSSKVIYTAHGFHFFEGNNIIKNFIFRNIEKYTARFTDILITINEEDHNAAKKFKLKESGRVYKLNGVGLDVNKFSNVTIDRDVYRSQLGLKQADTMLLSVGELSSRKNHQTIIKALAKLNNPQVHYYIAGTGDLKDYLENLANSLGLSNQVHLLGYRTDIKELLKSCDIYCFPSLQEGLPVALMEAMAADAPIVASKIRGNIDLIKDGGGFLCAPLDIDCYAKSINSLLTSPDLKQNIIEKNQNIIQNYNIKNIAKTMYMIYSNIITLN